MLIYWMKILIEYYKVVLTITIIIVIVIIIIMRHHIIFQSMNEEYWVEGLK